MMSAMNCPNCGSRDVQVIDSRAVKSAGSIRRRRVCLSCEARWTTYEGTQIAKRIEINTENTMDRRSRMLRDEESATANASSPDDGSMVWYAFKRFEHLGIVYNRDCLVDPETLGAGFERLRDKGVVKQKLRSQHSGAVQQKKKEVSSEPPKAKVEVVVFHDDDPAIAWKKSLEATAARCNGDKARALDLLCCTRSGGDLYTRFVRVQSERNAREAGTYARRIVPAAY